MKIKFKKAQTGMIYFPVIAFIIGLITFFVFISPNIKDSIGQKQGALLKAIPEGELTLSYIDSSARLSGWDSAFSLGQKGGFYFEQGDDGRIVEEYPCGSYVYNKWGPENNGACWPTKNSVEGAFSSYFTKHLIQDYLTKSTFDLPANLVYENKIVAMDNKTIIYGVTDAVISKVTSYDLLTTTTVNSQPVSKVAKFSDETITPCCDGSCIVDVAQKYVDKFGAKSNIKLPYVLGGETPYDIQKTINDAKNQQSFFHGVEITLEEPGKSTITRPGFDCSGFTWWVYKHAGISEFNSRASSEEYYSILSQKNKPICEADICDKAIKDGTVHPGDVIIRFSGSNTDHMAIYAGNGEVIDSSIDNPVVGIQKRQMPKHWLSRIKIYRPTYNTGCVDENIKNSPDTKTSSQNLPEVGILSAKYESAKDGSLAIGYDTTGKTSYGKYQISSATMSSFLKFVKDKNSQVFLKLSTSGSPNCDYTCNPTGCYSSDARSSTCSPSQCYLNCEFSRSWKDLVNSGAMGNLEHDFIKSTHYDSAVNGIRKVTSGLDINERSFALQNVVWSVSVQHGAVGATNIFTRAGVNSKMSDEEIIKAVYHEREKVDVYFASSTSSVQKSVLNRFISEEKDALDMLKNGVKGVLIQSDANVEYYTKKDFGYYDVNPSFTTEINYDLSIYDKLSDWARATYESCTATQKQMQVCVDDKKKEQNDLYDNLASNKSKELTFKFVDNFICDGSNTDFYNFVETVEDCFDLGNPNCNCKPKSKIIEKYEKITINAKTISKTNNFNEHVYYDFSSDKILNVSINRNVVDEFTLSKDESNYVLEFNGNKLTGKDLVISKIVLNNIDVLDFSFAEQSQLKKTTCSLDQGKENFRFCALSNQLIPQYDSISQSYKISSVPIKFSMNMKKAPPPDVTHGTILTGNSNGAVNYGFSQEDSNDLCVDFGSADIELKAMTKDLICNYDKFASSLSSIIPPQIKVATFLTSFLKIDNLPAAFAISIDFKNAKSDCDVKGIVYKCGPGVPPINKDGSFDFSNPDGFIDLSQKFNNNGIVQKNADGSITLKNPDGKIATKSAKFLLPQYTDDKTAVSFVVSDCQEKITQFKKPENPLDILKIASLPTGYYFAFAYVDSSGKYGKTTIKSSFIGPVIDQLYKQLGLVSQVAYLKDTIISDATDLYSSLSSKVIDQYSIYKKALGVRSFDDILNSATSEVRKKLLDKIPDQLSEEEVRELFDKISNGKIPYEQARELLNPLIDKLDVSEARSILASAVEKSSELKDEIYNALSSLSLPEKVDILKKLYPEIDWSKFSEAEINQKIREVVNSRPDLEKLMKYLPDATAIKTATDLIKEAPEKMISVVNSAISEARKLEIIKDNLLNNANSQLASLIAHYSPDRIKADLLKEAYSSLNPCNDLHPLDVIS